jgi:hypothetical protein
LGFAYGNWRSSWEQKMIIEGAVAHYGYSKVLKLGLDQDLSRIRQALDRWTTAYLSLPSTDAKLSEKDTAGLAKQRQAIGDGLMICGESLARLQEAYALSPQEQAALAMYVNERMAQLHSIDAGRPPAKAKDLLTDPSPARDAKSGPPERPPDGAIPMSNETPAPHLDASTSDADLPPSTSSDNTPAIGDSPVSPTND